MEEAHTQPPKARPLSSGSSVGEETPSLVFSFPAHCLSASFSLSISDSFGLFVCLSPYVCLSVSPSLSYPSYSQSFISSLFSHSLIHSPIHRQTSSPPLSTRFFPTELCTSETTCSSFLGIQKKVIIYMSSWVLSSSTEVKCLSPLERDPLQEGSRGRPRGCFLLEEHAVFSAPQHHWAS